MRAREILPDEKTYWEELRKKAPRQSEFNRNIVDYFRGKPGINIGLREKSIVVSISLNRIIDSFTIVCFWIKGYLQIAPKTIRLHLSKGGYSDSITNDFRNKMRHLFGTSAKQEEITGNLSIRTVEEFKKILDEFIQRIRAEEG